MEAALLPRSTVTSIVLAACLLLPAVGAITSTTRVVHRDVASPLGAMPDAAHWRIDVPAGHAVRVRADSNASLFTLTWCAQGNACTTTLPTNARDLELQARLTDAWWTVSLDPAAGARMDAFVRFDGFLVDVGNAPAEFALTDLPSDAPCFSGACLP